MLEGHYRETDEKRTGTVGFDQHVSHSVRPVISELLSENAQLHPLSGDLPSRTADFGSQPVLSNPKTGVPAHKMIVI